MKIRLFVTALLLCISISVLAQDGYTIKKDSIKSVPTGGDADNFVRFFREELIPYIDKNFKQNPTGYWLATRMAECLPCMLCLPILIFSMVILL